MIEPGIFAGTLRHRRHAPIPHAFTYPLFMALLDIDRIPELMSASVFTSYNRWNWASFDERDHLGDAALPLRARVAASASSAGITLPDGPIFLLTHLRYLGYCFNPISFFYACDRGGRIQRVLAEVHNTVGGKRTYWLAPESERRTFRSSAAKALYVSPFMGASLNYHFALTPPGEQLVAHIDAVEEGRRVLDATLTLERRPWSAAEIKRQLVRHPVMTGTVMAAIHWEALRLWWKGVPVMAMEH